jgi:uncharacterized protein with HEPN domain
MGIGINLYRNKWALNKWGRINGHRNKWAHEWTGINGTKVYGHMKKGAQE